MGSNFFTSLNPQAICCCKYFDTNQESKVLYIHIE
jgi:hypothetical protein